MFGGTSRTVPTSERSATSTPSQEVARQKSRAELDLEAIRENPSVAKDSPKPGGYRRASMTSRQSSPQKPWEPESSSTPEYDTKAEEMAARFGGKRGSVASVASTSSGHRGPSRADSELDESVRSSIGQRRTELRQKESTPEPKVAIRRRSSTEADAPPEPKTPPNRNQASAANPMRARSSTSWTPQKSDPCSVCSDTVSRSCAPRELRHHAAMLLTLCVGPGCVITSSVTLKIWRKEFAHSTRVHTHTHAHTHASWQLLCVY
jgi:hypothetical protein